jgi:hypothetical protein
MPTPVAQPSKRTPRKNLWINYQDEDLAQQVLSHFGTTDTTEAKIAALSRWLRWSLEKLEAEAQPAVDCDSAPHSPPAASDRPEEGDPPAIATATASPHPPQAEPSTMSSPDAQPSSTVGELKSMFAQTLEMFQALMQAQLQPSAMPTGNGVSALSASTTSERTSPTDQHSSPAAAASTATPTAPEKNRPKEVKPSRRSKSPETQAQTAALTQQILNAIQDIEHYNLYIDQTGQPHRLKREITTNFLKALTPNQRLINRMLDERQAQVQQHHQQMHIQPGHNSSYREKITLEDILRTLQAGDRPPQN